MPQRTDINSQNHLRPGIWDFPKVFSLEIFCKNIKPGQQKQLFCKKDLLIQTRNPSFWDQLKKKMNLWDFAEEPHVAEGFFAVLDAVLS